MWESGRTEDGRGWVKLTLSEYPQSATIEKNQIKYRNLSGKWISKSIGLDKYLDFGSNLKAYLQVSNITLDNDLGLNLYIIPTTYYMVVISENQELVRKRT